MKCDGILVVSRVDPAHRTAIIASMKKHVRSAGGVIGLALAGVLAGLPSPARAAAPGWTHDGFGPGNTGYNAAESVVNAEHRQEAEAEVARDAAAGYRRLP
nr:hypothetical protein GCM10020092_004410 [Actinoplanes digitatis]